MNKRIFTVLLMVAVVCFSTASRRRFQSAWRIASGEFDPLSLSPESWYKGNGNATDSITDVTATWFGTEQYTTGINGQAFDINGSSYILGNLTCSDPDNISLVAWCYPVNDATGQTTYFLSIGTPNGLGIRWRDGNWYVGYNGLAAYFVAAGTSGTWTHIAMTRRGGHTWCYINGVEYDVTTDTIPTPNNNIIIGAATASVGRIIGYVDDYMCFSKPLTAADIQNIYEWRAE